MIPLPAYIAHLQPNLGAGYTDFRYAIAFYIGHGSEPDLWTMDQKAELHRDIQEAYRELLYPPTMPGEMTPHVWSFLQPWTTLTTTEDDYDQTLPADFGSFVGQYMLWPEGQGYSPPYRTNPTNIMALRQHRSTSGRPQCFAIHSRAQTSGLQQRQEVLWYPTPDDEYVLNYPYAVLTGKLSRTNPYPLGGPRMAQLMIEACKAVGEAKRDGVRGDQWGRFLANLHSAIRMDKATNTSPTVGQMRGASINIMGLQQTRPNTSYYFGPSVSAHNLVDGAYTLET